jgi:hypothetical protein
MLTTLGAGCQLYVFVLLPLSLFIIPTMCKAEFNSFNPILHGLVVLPSLLGVSLNFLLWLVARRDLRLMRAGLMDSDGREQTEKARRNAAVAVVVSVAACLLVWIAIDAVILFDIFSPRGTMVL